uniref:Uncharacterized protein n=1 Tax=Leersia perrieri TaxID=77586 RepID=A0A0D9X5M7_9ORYZ
MAGMTMEDKLDPVERDSTAMASSSSSSAAPSSPSGLSRSGSWFLDIAKNSSASSSSTWSSPERREQTSSHVSGTSASAVLDLPPDLPQHNVPKPEECEIADQQEG